MPDVTPEQRAAAVAVINGALRRPQIDPQSGEPPLPATFGRVETHADDPLMQLALQIVSGEYPEAMRRVESFSILPKGPGGAAADIYGKGIRLGPTEQYVSPFSAWYTNEKPRQPDVLDAFDMLRHEIAHRMGALDDRMPAWGKPVSAYDVSDASHTLHQDIALPAEKRTAPMDQTQYISTDANAGDAPPRGYLSMDPHAGSPPRGSERTRPDTNILGVDHEQLRQAITNWAALSPHVPEALRGVAARTGSYFGDVGASIAELLSAPENVAGLGAPRVVPALDAVVGSRQALRQPADLAIEALLKRTGLDPAALDLATTRLRLQAARSRTRQANIRGDLAGAPAPTSAVASAPETSPVAAGPARLSASASAPPPSVGRRPLRLTSEERQAAEALVLQGYPREVVLAQLAQHREALLAQLAERRAASPAPQLPPEFAPVDAPVAPPPSVPSAGAQGPLRQQELAQQFGGARPRLTAAETKEYGRLLRAGKSAREAMDLIEAQRTFQRQHGLPTSEQTRRAVKDRNETGRWPDER